MSLALGFGALLVLSMMVGTMWVRRLRERSRRPRDPRPATQEAAPAQSPAASCSCAADQPVSSVPMPYAEIAEARGLDIIGWRGRQDRKGGWKGHECPKCLYKTGNEPQAEELQLCACGEHDREHFHFKCGGCGYVAIMRCADDTAESVVTRRSAPVSISVN